VLDKQYWRSLHAPEELSLDLSHDGDGLPSLCVADLSSV
jgi:hypothetical protein